jgi:hypothetical protein
MSNPASNVSNASASPSGTRSAQLLSLGFLTVLHEATGYVGGYLVTNQWGRPLEFRLSTPVQPNRVQQILYGDSLEPYICGELIGMTLVEKTSQAVQVVITDTKPGLELRTRIDLPVALLTNKAPLRSHPRFAEDTAVIDQIMERVRGNLDLAEPFGRIREAIAEARKLGVTSRG